MICRQRQERRVEGRDEEQAGGTQGGGDGLYPGKERLHDHDRLSRLVVPCRFWSAAAAALVIGIAAAWHYAALDLTLSHYDAEGHLVVARRIVDSLRPGWWQIGAVWLPLPHLLNMGPVQVDAWYRSGASGVAISIVSYAAAVGAVAWLVHRATGSVLGALAGAIALASQPDVLYLQSTPMTEPLLMALTLGGVALTWRWAAGGGVESTAGAGSLLALACLTRYEAWPITAAAIGGAALAFATTGVPTAQAARRLATLALYPIVAGLGFLLLSRATVGSWLVTGGFFVADNPDYHRPFKSMGSVWWGRQVERSGLGLARRRRARAGPVDGAARSRPTRAAGHARARRLRGTAGLRLLQRPPVPRPLHGGAGDEPRRDERPRRRPAAAPAADRGRDR